MKSGILRLGIFLWLLALAGGCGAPAARPPLRPGQLRVIGFFDQSRTTSAAALDTLSRYPHAIDYLSPFWYLVGPTGTVSSKLSAPVFDWAHTHGVRLMPLFTNAGGTDAFLLDSATRAAAVRNVVSIARQEHFAGVSIDFELLPTSARDGMTAFMSELAAALRPLHTKLTTVDVIPSGHATGAHGAYNYQALARYVNQVILMTYDRHDPSSPPGPVAPLPWVEASIRSAIASGIPPGKIYLGVATYGYDWPAGGRGVTVPLKDVRNYRHVQIRWDNTDKETYFTYMAGGIQHTVWYEGERSLPYKIDLAKKYHLHGIAIWRVGFEDQPYWASLERLLGRKNP